MSAQKLTDDFEEYSSVEYGVTTFKYGTASVDVCRADTLGLTPESASKLRYIKSLYVDPENRNKGIARLLINHVIDKYHDKSLLVNPEPYDDAEVTQKDLIKFYQSLGFRKLQEGPLLMVRHPQPPKIKQSTLIIADAYGRVQ